jgi:hypothetical protein
MEEEALLWSASPGAASSRPPAVPVVNLAPLYII